MKKKMVALLAGAMLMMGMATSAMALTMTVSDGINAAVTFTSGTSGVTAGTGPSLNFTYNNFYFYNLSAFTKYGLNKSFQDQAAINVEYSGSGAANLTITVSDISYNLNSPLTTPNTNATLKTHVNEITNNAAVTFSGYFDNANALGGTTNLIGTLGPLNSTNLDDELVAQITTSNPFSLTEIVNIAFTTAGEIVSLDSTLTVAPVPEPGTMMLVGLGMLGMAVYGKRRQNKEA